MDAMEAVLRELTLADLRDWAGGNILARAQTYVRCVNELSCTPDGRLAAWVQGSGRYVTTVRLPERGEYEYACTCPYEFGGPCKHAVAVVLAAGGALAAGKAIAPLDPDSELAESLCEYFEDLDDEDLRSADGDGDDDDGESGEVADDMSGAGRRQGGPAPGRKGSRGIAAVLRGLGADEMRELLGQLAAQYPEVRRDILEADQLARGQAGKLERSLREEIHALAAEPAWRNVWKGTAEQPDYSHLEAQLRALLQGGHPDAVLRLGAELWDLGRGQVEQSDDGGETAMRIAACLAVVLEAVPRSSLAPAAQLLWIIERALADEFDLLPDTGGILGRRAYTKAHWREVAQRLTERLRPGAEAPEADSSASYRRVRLLHAVLDACARAGWQERIVPLLEAEADTCRCQPRLVDELLAAGEEARARDWCIRGYASTIEKWPGIAQQLQQRLRELARRHRRHDLVAAYAAQDFCDRPSIEGFADLRKAAERARCWPAVRAAVLDFLESGKEPGANPDWPLPAPEVRRPASSVRHAHRPVPDHELLTRIAIAEKRLEDVVSLHQRMSRTRGWRGGIDVEVATALAATHPDIALAIRRRLAEELIAQVKPSAYEGAAGHLRAMRDIYVREKRLMEWEQLMTRLRTVHRAKRRLLQVLDTLSAKRIV